ncbi:RNA-binding protein [Angomonas deanei]|uniref:RNA recognition motif. (A.k.a. RRM, RBD, or RNP domain), putative n=1 Tax=Angomonas deanei TaxID=59799 RepID=A0A7G2CHZ5_9TRYP|nr:RNA-binding protein [Angomonas deanei]CAD2219376.1 RNA recognition motif. (a.k.a. RRM, RBD, or RNP domain), putative [Angomonas deanei]|eukprot:EPY28385.1 RNA-binding protein [Angomonas deanei]
MNTAPVSVPPPESDPKNLIVNYIPTPVTDAELRELFSPFGTVESARVILDRLTNHPKGYGFVKYTTEEAAKKAIQHMNGFELGNKRLRVTQANGPQNKSMQQYTDRIVHLQQPQPMRQTVPVQMPMPYTFIGTRGPHLPPAVPSHRHAGPAQRPAGVPSAAATEHLLCRGRRRTDATGEFRPDALLPAVQ